MRVHTMRILVALAALLVAPGALAGIEFEIDDAADLGAYRTYAWRPGTDAGRAEVQGWIVAAVESELAARGLQKAATGSTPDVLVSTHVFTELDAQQRGSYFHLDRIGVGVIASDVAVTTRGVLILDLADAASGESVWRALGSEVMAPPRPAKLKRKIERAVREMLRRLPPRVD